MVVDWWWAAAGGGGGGGGEAWFSWGVCVNGTRSGFGLFKKAQVVKYV